MQERDQKQDYHLAWPIKISKTVAYFGLFTVTEDTRYVRCNSCNDKISCGGKTTKTFNTMNLVYHLNNKHTEQYSEYQKKLEDKLNN